MSKTIYTMDSDAYDTLRSGIDQLKAENQKLRKLVRDYDKMLEVSLIGYDGPDAPLTDAVHISLQSRMYELGFEVSE